MNKANANGMNKGLPKYNSTQPAKMETSHLNGLSIEDSFTGVGIKQDSQSYKFQKTRGMTDVTPPGFIGLLSLIKLIIQTQPIPNGLFPF